MALSPEAQKLFTKLMDKGLLAKPDISVAQIPEYQKPDLPPMPKLPNIRKLVSAPRRTTNQDFAAYILANAGTDKRTSKLFANQLATRVGAETEEEGFVTKLFDTLLIPNYTMAGIGGAIADGMDEDESFLENMGDVLGGVGKSLAGGVVRLADATVLNPAEMLPFGIGDKVTDSLKEAEEMLLPRKTFRDVLKENEDKFGIENNLAQTGLGLGLDIFTDPTTYTGLGLAKLLGRGAKTKQVDEVVKSNPQRALDIKAAQSGNDLPFLRPTKIPDIDNVVKNKGIADEGTRGINPGGIRELPQFERVNVPYDDGLRSTPLTRRLKRRQDNTLQHLAKRVEKGFEPVPPRTAEMNSLAAKWKKADTAWQKNLMHQGIVTTGSGKISNMAANEVVDRIIKGKIDRAPTPPRATGADAMAAREVADNMIDKMVGTKKNLKQYKDKGIAKIVPEFFPIQQVQLVKHLLPVIGKENEVDSLIGGLRAAEDHMITLGVQPVWHNGLRVRLSDVLNATKHLDVPFEQVLNDFVQSDLKKVTPEVRAIIHGLEAQRSVVMSDVVKNATEHVARFNKSIDENYIGRENAVAKESAIEKSLTHAVQMGATNREIQGIKNLLKDVVDVNKLPAESWIEKGHAALLAASKEGRVPGKLVDDFNTAVAKTLGHVRQGKKANLNTRISGSNVVDAIMTRVATWWGKGDLWNDARSVFIWGEQNAVWRARVMRHYARNTTIDQRREAWRVALGQTTSADATVLGVANFLHKYMGEVLRTPLESALKTNAGNKSLSVAERSGAMMDDVNRHLKQMGNHFQFTNAKQVTRGAGVDKVKYHFSEGNDWMKSWILNEPDDPINFIYDIDLAMERVTKEYAFLDDFVDKFGRLEKTNIHDFKIPSVGAAMRVSDFYAPKEQVQQLMRTLDTLDKGMYKPNTPFGRYYGKALRIWKTGVTIYLPSHHIRNAIGDTYLMWMAGHNNINAFRMAKRIMVSQRGRYNQAIKSGDFEAIRQLTDPSDMRMMSTEGSNIVIRKNGIELSADDIYTAAFQRGLLLDANVLEDVFGESTVKFGLPGRAKGKVRGAATGAAEYREHYIRLAHFSSAVSKGLKKSKDIKKVMDDAAEEVRKWHPDGRDLTYFEQKYMRNIVPFYSWIRKSTPLLFESVLTRPAKTLMYPRGMVALQNALGIESSMIDPFPDDQLFPEWIRGYGIGPIGDPSSDNSIARWWGILGRNMTDINGNPTGYTSVNPSNPLIDSGQQFGGFGIKDTGEGILDSLTPFAKVPFELMSGNDFTGAPIPKDEGGQGVLHYLTKQIPLVSPVQRIGNFGDREREGVEDKNFDKESFINLLTALQVKGTGPYEKSAEFEAKDRLKYLREKNR